MLVQIKNDCVYHINFHDRIGKIDISCSPNEYGNVLVVLFDNTKLWFRPKDLWLWINSSIKTVLLLEDVKNMNHYEWLNVNLPKFFQKLGMEFQPGIIVAHGDKCYSYRTLWEQAGIPFEKGVAIYLLTYFKPFSYEVRETKNGWVDPGHWVVEQWKHLEKVFVDLDAPLI